MMRTIGLCIVLILFAYASVIEAAPSFDCQKAKTDIEHAICTDERLSDLDAVLDKVYKQALRRAHHPEKMKLEQMQWMKNRPNFDKRVDDSLRTFENNPAIMKRINRIEREISWRKKNNPHLQKSSIESLEKAICSLKNRNQDPEVVKSKRVRLKKSRPQKGDLDYEQKLISELQDDYLSRIDELLALKNEALCAFFLEEFLKNPEKVNQLKADRILVCLAMISFLAQTGKPLGYNLFDEIVDELLFTKLTPNKILVLLNTSKGAYRRTYDFYTIDKTTDTLHMKPYILPYEFGSDCNSTDHRYTGDFGIDFDKKEIQCCTRPVWYDMGECLTWKLTEDCGVLIEKR